MCVERAWSEEFAISSVYVMCMMSVRLHASTSCPLTLLQSPGCRWTRRWIRMSRRVRNLLRPLRRSPKMCRSISQCPPPTYFDAMVALNGVSFLMERLINGHEAAPLPYHVVKEIAELTQEHIDTVKEVITNRGRPWYVHPLHFISFHILVLF